MENINAEGDGEIARNEERQKVSRLSVVPLSQLQDSGGPKIETRASKWFTPGLGDSRPASAALSL